MEDAILQPAEAAAVTVEELPTAGGETVAVAVVEPEPPKNDLEVGYRYGLLEARLAELETQNARLAAQLIAFEQATVAAVEIEADEIEKQGAVVAAVAEEVLPPDDEAATAHNPDHGGHKGTFFERLLGGHHHRSSD